MSLLGKYRKDEQSRDEKDKDETASTTESTSQTRVRRTETVSAVPNSERRSPIMSFSVTTELRSCLQSVRNEHAINLSMWVERKLRDAVTDEFPELATKYLE